MNIDDITKINHKSYNNTSFKNNYIKKLITRILISIIIIISIAILVKIDKRNILYIKDHVFIDSIKFTKINKWYQDNLGKIIPNTKQDSMTVFSSNDLNTKKYEKYLDGIKIDDNKGNPISIIYGGIVVFIGEKEGYNNTVIIQGNDGIDYWYGNIVNTNVNLYDYIEKDTIIGEANDDYIYLVLEKDGKYINYEEYIEDK